MMSAVFAMQGFGQFAAAMVSLIVTVSFKQSLECCLLVETKELTLKLSQKKEDRRHRFQRP
jgi:hypothetical protein